MTRVVLVTPDETYAIRVRAVTDRIDVRLVHMSSDIDSVPLGVSSAIANQPNVVVLGPDVDADLAQRWTEALDEGHPSVTTIWVIEPEADTWRQALRAGARDLIDPHAGDHEIEAALTAALAIHDRRFTAAETFAEATPLDVGGGRLIAVASPKGGSGKTMFSTNLAYGLHEQGKQVVLVDLDLQFGDVASALHLRPEYTVIHGLNAAGDATAVKAFLTPHPNGMFVLTAPTNPAEADQIDYDALAKLLDLLRNEFEYVVVDTGAGIDEPTLRAIEQATDVAFVTSTDLAAIQALRKVVLVLDQLELTNHRRWYVLNRADARVGLSKSDIEESTGLAIDVTIPSSRVVPIAMNQGVTVLEDDPRSTVGRAVQAAVDLFATGEHATKESPSRFGRWFRKGA